MERAQHHRFLIQFRCELGPGPHAKRGGRGAWAQRLETEQLLQLGMIGLGRMGANMTTRLIRGGHQVVAYDRDPTAVQRSAGDGATAASSLRELVAKLAAPRAVWIMGSSGDPPDSTNGEL